MSKSSIKVKKLVAHRERERDRASTAVARALKANAAAKKREEEALSALLEEIEKVRKGVGQPVQADEMMLALECVVSAHRDKRSSASEVEKTEEEVAVASEQLMNAHIRVKQMQKLLQMKTDQLNHEADAREQRENDDLAATKGRRNDTL